jgi:uncharacterized SAM-binding protein YcdF (DUF218 family)
MVSMYEYLKSMIAWSVPIPLCLGVLLIGLILLWIKKKQEIGKIIVTVGFLLLMIFSFPFFPNLILGYIEEQHRSFDMEKIGGCESLGIKYIVVLASSHILDPKIPITSQFSCAGLVRLIEGIRLYKKCPGAKLILSGGKGRNTHISDAELMGDLAFGLGVPRDDIILEKESMSTEDETKLLKPILKAEKFLLVTSASHMPRSMGLFRKLGMNPIPAPTGHLVKHFGDSSSILPSVSNLKKSGTAFYEILGIIKEKVLGRI